jgi:CAP-Gly domain
VAYTKALNAAYVIFFYREMAVVRYIGHTDFAPGIWIGLELKNPKGMYMMVDLCVAEPQHFLTATDTNFVAASVPSLTYRKKN